MTPAHIKEVSLAALFLLETANKEFGMTPQSRKHAVREALDNTLKIVKHLMEAAVTIKMQGRSSSCFVHPMNRGWENMNSPEWLATVLKNSFVEEGAVSREVLLEYELSDV